MKRCLCFEEWFCTGTMKVNLHTAVDLLGRLCPRVCRVLDTEGLTFLMCVRATKTTKLLGHNIIWSSVCLLCDMLWKMTRNNTVNSLMIARIRRQSVSVTIESYPDFPHQFLLFDLLLCQCRQWHLKEKRLGHFDACILGRELGLKSLH